MPIYEFECKKCKDHLEVFQKMNDKPPVKCRKCGGRLEKLVSASAIQFKGSGWYVTDYAGNGRMGLFEKPEDHYGEIWYEMNGQRVMERSTIESAHHL